MKQLIKCSLTLLLSIFICSCEEIDLGDKAITKVLVGSWVNRDDVSESKKDRVEWYCDFSEGGIYTEYYLDEKNASYQSGVINTPEAETWKVDFRNNYYVHDGVLTIGGYDCGEIKVIDKDKIVFDGAYYLRIKEFIVEGKDIEEVKIKLPPADEIWYESHSGKPIPLAEDSPLLVSNTYSNGKGVYKFREPLTSIAGMFDYSTQCGTTKENEDFKSLTLPTGITSIKQFGISHLCKATSLVLPYNLSKMGSDCLCGFGEWTAETSNIYFIGENAPSFVSTSIWNMHDKVLGGNKIDNFYYPESNDTYSSLLKITIQGSATHNWVPAKYLISHSK